MGIEDGVAEAGMPVPRCLPRPTCGRSGRRERDASLKGIVNEALRKGLSDLTTRPRQREPFKTKNVALGKLRLASIDNISESLAIAEAEAFR
jgi:hypothetical protein